MIKRLNILGLVLLILMSGITFAQQGDAWTVEKCEQKLNEWYPQDSGVDQEVWKKAVTTFFSKASNSNFKCLLGVVDQKRPSTARMWVGTFNAQGPQEIMSIDAATGDNTHIGSDGHTHSNTPVFANWIGECRRAGTEVRRGSDGNATFVSTRNVEVSIPTSAVDITAREMGIDPSEITTYITYGSRMTGPFLLHEGYQCENALIQGQDLSTASCEPTWGCVTIYPPAMRQLCENYLGDGVRNTGSGNPGGMFFFVKSASMPSSSGCSNALRGLERMERGEICTEIPVVAIRTSRNSTTRIASNEEGEEDESERRGVAFNRRSSGNSVNIFQVIIDSFREAFMGGASEDS